MTAVAVSKREDLMPVSAADLGYVKLRLARAFTRRPVLARHAIQYRLAEVGPARFDARALHAAVEGLVNTSACHLHEMSMLADPTADSGAVREIVSQGVSTLRALTTYDYSATLDELSRAVLSSTRLRGTIEDAPPVTPTVVSENNVIPRPSAFARVTKAGVDTVIWISHELPWIYPDDPRLWRILEIAGGAHVLIVARKVAPVSFPFLKAIGAFALQYHLPVFDNHFRQRWAPHIDEIGLPPVRWAPDLRDHDIRKKLRQFLNRPLSQRTEQMLTATSHGLKGGFAESTPSTNALLDWAENTREILPRPWIDSIPLWSRHKPDPPFAVNGDAGSHRMESDSSVAQPQQTRVTRIPVAAEVDRNTWDELRERLSQVKK